MFVDNPQHTALPVVVPPAVLHSNQVAASTSRRSAQFEPAGAPYEYVGEELDLFAGATHWKAYVSRHIAPFLGAEVLEVGAGIGGTTRALWQPSVKRWVALEPDPRLAQRYEQSCRDGNLPARCELISGTAADMASDQCFDSVLYADVLEHIEDDRGELARVARHVRPGGHLIVLAPAHNWLFSELDRAVGHYRRYTARSLCALDPPEMQLAQLRYLDSVGLLASLANKLVLRRGTPTAGQIAVWDRYMVPCSTLLDAALAFKCGKSILAVWRKLPLVR
ncbi:MAG: class I SAM-dependent methyltransferase [Planctomycetes bacterium]|nr:class I SAM-dependent methyltransferase [Planctomycetota bacterium]